MLHSDLYSSKDETLLRLPFYILLPALLYMRFIGSSDSGNGKPKSPQIMQSAQNFPKEQCLVFAIDAK
jgi:hypothetical protein